jgi:hypothetical protein
MPVSARVTGIADAIDEVEGEIAEVITGGMHRAADGLKREYREQVVSAGLGQRLANTWRSEVYPKRGRSLSPAGYVWTNAPALVDAFSRGAQIVPLAGRRFLWIPTENVPRDRSAPRGSTRRAGPLEVEQQFNQDLIIRRGRSGRFLAFVNAVKSKNQKGWKRGTKQRLAQGRNVEMVLMFTLVPTVRMPKKLDVQGPAGRWAARVPSLIRGR